MASMFWDTMLFVYLIEDHPQFGDKVRKLLALCEEHGHSIATSTFTLGELLVAPRKTRNTDLDRVFRETLQPPAITLLPFGTGAADHYPDIRANLNVRAADALQLACAADKGVNVFVTNDERLVGKKVRGIDFIVGLDVKLM